MKFLGTHRREIWQPALSLAHNDRMSAGAAMTEPLRAETDVLVIGSGAAGMYAAIEAARAGCQVMLIDRSLIGRGGATVMAQMTVAVALRQPHEPEPRSQAGYQVSLLFVDSPHPGP